MMVAGTNTGLGEIKLLSFGGRVKLWGLGQRPGHRTKVGEKGGAEHVCIENLFLSFC